MALILVVDDAEPLRQMMREALEGRGHEVVEARNGRVAERLLAEYTFDLVVTDLLMPERDGLETIAAVRRCQPGTRILAVSGGSGRLHHDYLPAALKFGADRTMHKPFGTDQLIAAVEELLARRAGGPPAPSEEYVTSG